MKNSMSIDILTIPDLTSKPKLRKYLQNIRDWHGYIRFLGLPDRRDNPDILIDRLFVEPVFTGRYVSPDEDPSDWIDDAESIFDVLNRNKPIVLLGDPGSGKSTLLNYLIWLLARPTGSTWSERMGNWYLPMPIVLRELQLARVTDFLGLLHAFLKHPITTPLADGKYFEEMLLRGRAFVFLDGIDEIGSAQDRINLRAAVHDGFIRYPRCKWLLTSRIVGYEEVPFDRTRDSQVPILKPKSRAFASASRHFLSHSQKSLFQELNTGTEHNDVLTKYIGPFDDKRIEAFAYNWYIQREASAITAKENADHLVSAVHADDGILRLARIPNLLTMMALIHRVEAILPHGRALLYERISEAYLESIDKFRGVYSGAFDLAQKRRWLARVGYEMQERRSVTTTTERLLHESQLLVNRDEVISWLKAEMPNNGYSSADMSAEEFLDYVGRRSGLFLPRGEGRYAFVHLSFQEYFAAVALEREVTGLKWAKHKRTKLGLDRTRLASRAARSIWCETFVFLFELLASKEDWHEDVVEAVFGETFSRLESLRKKSSALELAHLLSKLLTNFRSGLAEPQRDTALIAVVRTTLERWKPSRKYTPISESAATFKQLINNAEDTEEIINAIGILSNDLAVQKVFLGGTRVANVSALARIPSMKELHLPETQVTDLTPLAYHKELRCLDVRATNISNIEALGTCPKLEELYLAYSGVNDIAELANLRHLAWLELSATMVSDVGPLCGAESLISLSIDGTKVEDLSPLVDLKSLEWLSFDNTDVSSIKPLASLTNLQSLDLANTQVQNLKFLSGLTRMEWLMMSSSGMEDLGIIRKLHNLKFLDVSNTYVSDIGPISELRKLRYVYMAGLKLDDLSALSGLEDLKYLDLGKTEVSSLQALRNITTLERVILQDVKIAESELVELGKSLPKCQIIV